MRLVGLMSRRHCEERSDEAIQFWSAGKAGLLRFARNDVVTLLHYTDLKSSRARRALTASADAFGLPRPRRHAPVRPGRTLEADCETKCPAVSCSGGCRAYRPQPLRPAKSGP